MIVHVVISAVLNDLILGGIFRHICHKNIRSKKQILYSNRKRFYLMRFPRNELKVDLFGLYCSIIPESPRWLYSRNKHERADAIVRRMAKFNKVDLPDKIDVELKVRIVKEKVVYELGLPLFLCHFLFQTSVLFLPPHNTRLFNFKVPITRYLIIFIL